MGRARALRINPGRVTRGDQLLRSAAGERSTIRDSAGRRQAPAGTVGQDHVAAVPRAPPDARRPGPARRRRSRGCASVRRAGRARTRASSSASGRPGPSSATVSDGLVARRAQTDLGRAARTSGRCRSGWRPRASARRVAPRPAARRSPSKVTRRAGLGEARPRSRRPGRDRSSRSRRSRLRLAAHEGHGLSRSGRPSPRCRRPSCRARRRGACSARKRSRVSGVRRSWAMAAMVWVRWRIWPRSEACMSLKARDGGAHLASARTAPAAGRPGSAPSRSAASANDPDRPGQPPRHQPDQRRQQQQRRCPAQQQPRLPGDSSRAAARPCPAAVRPPHRGREWREGQPVRRDGEAGRTARCDHMHVVRSRRRRSRPCAPAPRRPRP